VSAVILPLLASLMVWGTGGGLLLALGVAPPSALPRAARLSMIGAGVLALLWAAWRTLILIPTVAESLPVGADAAVNLTALCLWVAVLFAAMTALSGTRAYLVRWLALFGVPVLGLALIGIWSGNVIGTEAAAWMPYAWLLPGWALLVGIALYLISAFWLVFNALDERAFQQRASLGLLAVAALAHALLPHPLDLLLMGLGLGWAAVALIQQQTTTPLRTLENQLDIANADLKRMAKELLAEKARGEDLRTALDQAQKYRREFMANMSHELRTPLNSIIGYSELLQSPIYGDMNPKQSERLQRIHRNGTHLATLINAILDLSRIESGALRFKTTRFSPYEVSAQALANIEPLTQTKGLDLRSELADGLPMLLGDQKRIQQVLDNLLDNAVKFTATGHVLLQAREVVVIEGETHQFDLPSVGWLRDGRWIIFSVEDTGVGIAPEDQHRVFEQFAQVDGSRTREFDGIGLGLAITKRLVEMHGGAIWMRSQPGQGTTFFAALPVEVVTEL